MTDVSEGTILWEPSEQVIQEANLSFYRSWLRENFDLEFKDYDQLWRWSVDKPDEFWGSIWDYFDVTASKQPEAILVEPQMPGARWFPGAELNYAENFFDRKFNDRPAIIFKAEGKATQEISWTTIEIQTNALRQALQKLGVGRGDRVVAYLPNIPETIVALFAVASIGAIWSSCSPDFGSRSVLDRFQQIEPKVLISVDGYRYNGKAFDRIQEIAKLQAELPTLEWTILIPYLNEGVDPQLPGNTLRWPDLLAQSDSGGDLTFEQVPFSQPLWVLYSSGTTGLPKPIVHSHGGILLEHLKMASLQLDLKPGDRFFWYTSTGWMMWNFLVGGLLAGATIVVYDGSPAYPDLSVLWQLADEVSITYFGTSAAFIHACMKADVSPVDGLDLGQIRAVGSTGSPLSVDGFNWVYEQVNRGLALESISGGTDLCTAFVGGCRLKPVYAGELQAAALGAKVEAYNEAGKPIVGEVGELVISQPMPSMPIYFWNDPDDRRYKASYFEMYPGVWQHGDWIKFNEHGGCIIYGRSDSTINRQGIRMGTSEIYRAVESIPEVVDSLVIDLEHLGRESTMALFVVLVEDTKLDEGLKNRIRQKIRSDISPRHVPDEILQIHQVPYTLSGKKMEVPIRRVLLGQPPSRAINPGAMRNPETVQYFIDLANTLRG